MLAHRGGTRRRDGRRITMRDKRTHQPIADVGDLAGIASSADWRGNNVRPDITTVRLEGVEPSHVVLASRAGDRSRLLAAFRKLAEAHLTGPSST